MSKCGKGSDEVSKRVGMALRLLRLGLVDDLDLLLHWLLVCFLASALNHCRHLLRWERLHHLSCALQVLMTESRVPLTGKAVRLPVLLAGKFLDLLLVVEVALEVGLERLLFQDRLLIEQPLGEGVVLSFDALRLSLAHAHV